MNFQFNFDVNVQNSDDENDFVGRTNGMLQTTPFMDHHLAVNEELQVDGGTRPLKSWTELKLDESFTIDSCTILSKVVPGHGQLLYPCPTALNQLMTTRDDGQLWRMSEATDLIPQVYEGGLKIWEGSLDLLHYIANNLTLVLHGKQVLEFGCGYGLPGVFALKHGATVHFQDYNEDVLKYVTMPVCRVNLPPDNNKKGSVCGLDHNQPITSQEHRTGNETDRSIDERQQPPGEESVNKHSVQSRTPQNCENHPQNLVDEHQQSRNTNKLPSDAEQAHSGRPTQLKKATASDHQTNDPFTGDWKDRCRFFAADWEGMLGVIEPQSYNIMMSAETIYCKENYQKILKLIQRGLKKGGICIMAAKVYYFGIGGSMRDFQVAAESTGDFSTQVVENITSSSVHREILQIRWIEPQGLRL